MNVQSIISLLKAYNPQKIILFGSRASGQAGGESDWDIAVIKDTDDPYHDRVIAARRLLRTTVAVDLFVFTQEELNYYQAKNPLIHEIVAKGKVIYG